MIINAHKKLKLSIFMSIGDLKKIPKKKDVIFVNNIKELNKLFL